MIDPDSFEEDAVKFTWWDKLLMKYIQIREWFIDKIGG